MEHANENEIYRVVFNLEEQFSIWPEYMKIPNGWKSCNFEGCKDECIEYIKENWVDMKPLSLRKKMAANG